MAANGSDDCLTVLFRSHLEAGDTYACPWPTYSLYDTLATIQGVEPKHVPYEDWETGEWDLPAALATTGSKLTFIANPNNPSGTLVSLDSIAELATQLDGMLVIDEAYIDFATAEIGDCSALQLLEAHPEISWCCAPSPRATASRVHAWACSSPILT